MDNHLNKRNLKRKRRLLRVRKNVKGTSIKPRLSVLKTNRHISAQLIDDENHFTLACVGTTMKHLRNTEHVKKSKEAAKHVGQRIAQIAMEKNIESIVFDRGRLKYHGIIAELADAAREAGLRF